jgi:YfiH family protein
MPFLVSFSSLRVATVPAMAAVPGLVHGFERRLGRGGEERDATRRRVAAALASRGRLFLMRQVHGARVVAAPWEAAPEADAAVAGDRGYLLGIETADCLPVLLVDSRRGVVAAAHAGWRGTVAGVVSQTLAALGRRGSAPEDLLVAVGPGIGPCCYEVGDDVRAAFGPRGEGFFRSGPRGRAHLDLRAANVRQLEEGGVPRERIHHVPDCTVCSAESYYSYRRDGRGVGRMISFIGWGLTE